LAGLTSEVQIRNWLKFIVLATWATTTYILFNRSPSTSLSESCGIASAKKFLSLKGYHRVDLRPYDSRELFLSVTDLRNIIDRSGFNAKIGVGNSGQDILKFAPCIALIRPSHFVVVQRIDEGTVAIWDPDFPTIESMNIPLSSFSSQWKGVSIY